MARGFNTSTQYSARLGEYKMEIGYLDTTDVEDAIKGSATTGAADISETHCVPTRLTHIIAGWMYSQCEAGDGYVGCITGSGPVWDCTGGLETPDTTSQPIVCFTIDTSCSGAGGDYYILIGW